MDGMAIVIAVGFIVCFLADQMIKTRYYTLTYSSKIRIMIWSSASETFF